MKISAVIPVLNEEDIIEELCQRTADALASITNQYQVIIVDDGSTDRTWERLQEQARNNPCISCIRFSRNFGQHPAITAGLDFADSDWVVVMDGDLQDRPEKIPDLYGKAQEGYDVVFVRRKDRPVSLAYKVMQRAFYILFQWLTGTKYNPEYGNFSIISRRVLYATKEFRENIRFYGGMIFWLGFKTCSIEDKHDTRLDGDTSYTLSKRIKLAYEIIIAHSERPLIFAIFLGMLSVGFAVCYSIYVLIKAIFFGFAVQGWASLIISIYLVGGILMALTGVTGLYIGKIFTQVKNRPIYVKKDLLNLDE